MNRCVYELVGACRKVLGVMEREYVFSHVLPYKVLAYKSGIRQIMTFAIYINRLLYLLHTN